MMANPSKLRRTTASENEVSGNLNKLGYVTYVQFMLDYGRNWISQSRQIRSQWADPTKTFMDDVDGQETPVAMGPKEQPMHAVRKAILATANLIKSRNLNVGDPNQKDRVGVSLLDGSVKTSLEVALTTDYDSFKQFCANIRTSQDNSNASVLDRNIKYASEQLLPGAQGRAYSRKIVIIISDSCINDTSIPASEISAYQSLYPYPEYYWFHNQPPPAGVTDPRYEPDLLTRNSRNGLLMTAHQGYATGVEFFAVKVGFTSNQVVMNALADFGGTANTANEAPIVTDNPDL
jgi:hypothetical protein